MGRVGVPCVSGEMLGHEELETRGVADSRETTREHTKKNIQGIDFYFHAVRSELYMHICMHTWMDGYVCGQALISTLPFHPY